jgi:hypothetical protein
MQRTLDMSIPNCILQVAIGTDYVSRLPIERLRTNLLSINAGYEYVLLTDAESLEFLITFYSEYLPLYYMLERPQYKSDLVRYLYIYHYGGYYVDIDLLPSMGFDELSKKTNNAHTIFTIGAHGEGKVETANGFFASTAKKPIFLEFVNEMLKEPNPSDYGMNVKRMFRILSAKYNVISYHSENNVYFLREFGPVNNAYNIFVNHKDHVCYSNGHNYP